MQCIVRVDKTCVQFQLEHQQQFFAKNIGETVELQRAVHDFEHKIINIKMEYYRNKKDIYLLICNDSYFSNKIFDMI